MPKDSNNFVDQYDWELESARHLHRMEEGATFEEDERLPARIVVKIKSKKNDNQTNKRAFSRTRKKGLQP